MNMKAIISIITLSAAASLLNAPVLWAQETAPEPAGLPPAKEAIRVSQDELAKAQAEAKAGFAKARQQMEHAKKEMAKAVAEAGAGGFSGGYSASSKPVFAERLQKLLVRAPDQSTGKALVIRSSESDPK